MIHIYKPFLSNYKKSALDAINTEWISNHGIYISLASEKLKSILGIKYCILMNNGTSATQCLFKSLKYKYPNISKIYVPNNVFVAPWNCCLNEYKNENIEVMKLDENTLNIDVSEDYIKSLDKNSAVCIVHNYGNIINVPRLKRIRPDLIFLEDNCEGLFGMYEKKYSGTESLCSSLSFYGNKTITTGEGGAFLTNDYDLYSYINNIHSHGMTKKRYIHDNIGFNFRMTNIQAAFLYDQLCDIDTIINMKKKIFENYDKFFSTLIEEGKVKKLKNENETEQSYWMYCILLPSIVYEDVEFYMNNKGIEIRPFFYDIHMHNHLNMIKNIHDNKFSNYVSSIGIILPSFPELTYDQQQYIFLSLKNCIDT